MGNACQTDRHLTPSVYLLQQDKQAELHKNHQQPDNNNALQISHPPLSKAKGIIKPILINCGRHSESTTTIKKKRCYKNFSNLCLKLGDQTSQQIKMRRILSKTNHIATLDLDLHSKNLGLAKQFIAFVTTLKHFRKIPNLQINYANLPYENFQKFCFALKHLNMKAPKKINVELWYNRSTRQHKPAPVIRALKKSRDLCDFSVSLTSIEDLKSKHLEEIFSSLKGHKNLQTLQIKCLDFTRIQVNAFNKAMKSLCHLKLSKITLDIGQREHSDAFKELFVILTNFAPSLQYLSLWPHLYADNSVAFSQHLSKFTHLSHLDIRGHPPEGLVFPYIENLMGGLKPMKSLPINFKVGFGFPWEAYHGKINKQGFIKFYQKLAFPKWDYNVKILLTKEVEYVLRKCYLENLQPRSSGLQIDFKACDRIDNLISLLDQVNLSQSLFLEFSKVGISGLKKTFDSLKKFPCLANFTISFTRNYQIDKKWIETLFDLLIQLPSSVVFLKLCFEECIHLTPHDIQFIISSLTRLRKLKNLTGLGLIFVDIVQFADGNGIELAKELKQMTQLIELELSFKGCYMLKDQGVLSLVENVKTMPRLQKGKALFEDCWYIGQSTIDTCQMESKDFSINFENCKKGQ